MRGRVKMLGYLLNGLPDFSIGYNKGYSQFSGLTKTFETDALTNVAVDFFKFWNLN
jgi:hypothetical protein